MVIFQTSTIHCVAVSGMQDQIATLFSQESAYHGKALQCLLHFRRRSPEVAASLHNI